MPKILCCGEALIDMLPCISDTGLPGFTPLAGGAVFNTAIALGRLGVTTELFTGLSSDLFGDILRSSLKASNVGWSLSAFSKRPTSLAFVKLVDGQATYTFYSENAADKVLTEDDLPTVPANIGTLFFGGISLVGEPCGSTYEALLHREKDKKVIMLDPNVRPDFIEDEGAYRRRIDAMVAGADLVKLSDQDLEWLLDEADLFKAAKQLLDKGPKAVFVTRGGEGALAVSHVAETEVPATLVEVVDTVGAGDTFNAGILWSLSKADLLHKDKLPNLTEAQLAAALLAGATTAAITVSRKGANPPWLSEL
jgi:fructokinase